jgi:hypothetical protein
MNMNFGEALYILKQGGNVARQNWNGKGMFLFLVPGSVFKVNRPPLLGIYDKGTELQYRSHIDMKYSDGTVGVWVASHSDMLMEDWFELV